MGGVAGHMDHLYDNRNLSFEKMKDIMQAGADAELSAEEKVDGQNLFLSYSIPEGKAKGARNKGHYRTGGLDARGLAQKFAGRGGLEKAFSGGFDAFEKAAESLSDEEKLRIFGPDANIWYNAEVMDPGTEGDPNDPGSVNVIKYDDKTLKIHNVGHFIHDRETDEVGPIPKGALETLDNALERMQRTLVGHNFNLARQAIIELQKLEDQTAIQQAYARIDSALAEENLPESATVQDYLQRRLMAGIDIDIDRTRKSELVKYLLGMPSNIGKREIKRGLPKELQKEIDRIVNAKRMILKEAILPIEMAIHDYTVEILKGLKSVFIADNDKEVKRLKNELALAVKNISEQGSDNPQAMEVMQFHLNKIKDFSQITTPIEAIVFDYDGHTYKFAGNFAPINQILGMFRYPPRSKKVTTESLDTLGAEIITEQEGKRVALLPGGFKPPHAGHYALAKHLSSLGDIDEVVVIIGKNPRTSKVDPPITITAEQSKRMWDLYTANDPNIQIQIQKGKTPVSDVYDLIADPSVFSEGDTVILGKSDKDKGDKRYARAQSYAERHNPGVKVEEKIMKQFGGEGMGGTTLRNLVALGNKENFLSKLPDHLKDSEKEEAWTIASIDMNERLHSFIDQTIEEISSMGGGSVEGGAGSFGPPNTYNPFVQADYYNRKRKKVKKAKR